MTSGIDRRQAAGLRLALQRMPKELTEEVRQAVRDGADELAEAMREGYRGIRLTGNLEDQVGISFQSNGLTAKVGFPGKRRRRRTFYAHFQEFGTRHNAPNPVQRDSLQRTKNKIADRLDRAVDSALDKFTRG